MEPFNAWRDALTLKTLNDKLQRYDKALRARRVQEEVLIERWQGGPSLVMRVRPNQLGEHILEKLEQMDIFKNPRFFKDLEEREADAEERDAIDTDNEIFELAVEANERSKIACGEWVGGFHERLSDASHSQR